MQVKSEFYDTFNQKMVAKNAAGGKPHTCLS